MSMLGLRSWLGYMHRTCCEGNGSYEVYLFSWVVYRWQIDEKRMEVVICPSVPDRHVGAGRAVNDVGVCQLPSLS